MAMGPLKRNKTLAGRARMFNLGFGWPWCPCKVARPWLGGSGCLAGTVDGHGALEHEQDSGWEGQDVQPGMLIAMGPMKRGKIVCGRVRMSSRWF